ncbi:MAG: type II toxin-antitoxin system RelE/ParE family toxin [Clostridia bacterium]|nr:type II toxin-antitoxin system RelE/ParE family toxin [Clostridia bacterium]MBR0229389.1 type II toxin-antitoxin system RelE/ParE family toxin [Clostridia bacterium]
MLAKTLRDIDMLEANGPALREPQYKALEPNLFELRTKVGSNISRVLYFFIVGKRIILTNGFIKKKDQTPESEKARARRYRDDYFRRYGK